MKRNTIAVIATAAAMILAHSSRAAAQMKPRAAGIAVRGSYWDMDNSATLVRVSDFSNRQVINTGGAGVWLNFFSRTSDNWYLEFNLGGVATVVEDVVHAEGEDVHVTAVVPVLLGMRYQFLSPDNQSALRPYFSFGAGPYWLADILVKDRYDEDEVTIDARLKSGGYAGGGLDFMITDWFGLNFDVKYHFVGFNAKGENSGYEYGLGIQFRWGNYRTANRHSGSK